MHERRTNAKGYTPPMGAGSRPADKPNRTPAPRPLEGPTGDQPTPDPPGPRAPRYNLTVRLSGDERDRLRAIGRTVGRPDPLTLAETVRWLIRQQRI